MPEAAFVMAPDAPRVTRELVAALRRELSAQQVPSTLSADFADPRPDRVWCLVLPGRAGGFAELPDDILRRTLVLSTAPAGADLDAGTEALLRRAGAVFSPEQPVVVDLHGRGIQARLLRPGFSPGEPEHVGDAERPWEIVVVGEDSPRRERWLQEHAEVLGRRRCTIPDRADAESGERWWSLLSGARIALHVHAEPGGTLGPFAPLEAARAGAVLVAESSPDLAPFTPGEHLFVAATDSLALVADALLRDPERIATVREAARTRVREWLPFALPVSVVRAVLVELLAQPLPAAVTPA